MALSDITKKILEDARAQADAEVRRAEASVREIEEEMKKLEKAYLEDEEKKLREKQASAKRERVAMYRQKVKSRVDAKKRELLDGVFLAAETALASLADDDRYALLERAIGSIDESIDDADVLVSARDTEAVKKILASRDGKYSVRVSEDISDGCVMRGEAFEYDLRFSEMLRSKQRSLEPEVAEVLFG